MAPPQKEYVMYLIIAASSGFLLGAGVTAAALIAHMDAEATRKAPPSAKLATTGRWSK